METAESNLHPSSEKPRAGKSGAGFTFKIITPEKVAFEKEVRKVTLPTSTGQITVLPHHIPLISNLVPGELLITDGEGKETHLAVSGGFVQVHPKKLVILADTADMAHEIDVSAAEEAHRRAEELLKQKAGAPDREYMRLKALMETEFARLKVARKYKQRG